MNAQATSHRHFHDELSELKVALLNMSGEAQAALASAVEAVLQRGGDKARDVIAGDRGIDHLQLGGEGTGIRLLAAQQPMARGLRFLTAAMKISHDLERVGDHAVHIARVADLATNIAEDVVFLVEGKSIKHHSEDQPNVR